MSEPKFEPKFSNGEWYRCRIERNGHWDVSPAQKTPLFSVNLLVIGGEMEGSIFPWEVYVSDNTRERVVSAFKTIGFDAKGTDLMVLEGPDSPIVGKEVWARCDIQPKERGGFYPPRAGEIAALADRIPGGPAYKAAMILGNTATKVPDPQAFASNF